MFSNDFKCIFLSIPLLALWSMGFSQSPSAETPAKYCYTQLLYHSGVTWSRTKYLDEQFSKGYRAVEARFGFQSDGNELWQLYHNYPKYGFGVNYSDLVINSDDTIIGNPLSAFGFFSAPLIRHKWFTLNVDISTGLSFTSKIHDPIDNPYNDVIASHINLYFDLNLNMNFKVSNRIDAYFGGGLTHHSNGSIHKPQKGMNNWGLNLGLSYHFRKPGIKSLEDDARINSNVRPKLVKNILPDSVAGDEIQLMYAVGTVEVHPLGDLEGVRYFTSSFTADYALGLSPINRLCFGMDVLYDGSLAEAIKGFPAEEVTTFQKMYLGSHMGYQILIHKLTLHFNFGTYFVQHSYDRGFWFARAGGRIKMTDHLQVHVCIKTKNGIRSDWIEWGLAYHIKIN